MEMYRTWLTCERLWPFENFHSCVCLAQCLICARGCLVAEDVPVPGLMGSCLQEANNRMKRDRE